MGGVGDTYPITSPFTISCMTPPSSPSITPLPSLPLESPPDVHAIHSIHTINPIHSIHFIHSIHSIHPIPTLFLQTIMSFFFRENFIRAEKAHGLLLSLKKGEKQHSTAHINLSRLCTKTRWSVEAFSWKIKKMVTVR